MPKFQKKTEIADRRRKALELRIQANTYRQIASKLGVSVRTAYKDVSTELEKVREVTSEKAAEVLQIELDRLDRLALALESKIVDGNERAIDTYLRVMDRRAKLLGIDAPQRVESTHDFGVDVEEVRARLLERLSASDNGD